MTRIVLVLVLALVVALLPLPGPAPALPLERIQLPPGFRITVYAQDVPGARSLARAPDGTLFVGTRDQGKVYALRDRDGDGEAETKRVVARGLNMPNGVAFRDGDLYVAEIHRVLRYPGILERLGRPPRPEVVRDEGLPSDRSHGWKFIAFGPDGKLYVPVGAPCNLCDPDLPYAALHRMEPDGSGLEVYARGIRNTVGFDWHPVTKELWFTDNGRDWLGDDRPPDELNHAPRPGMHFGYPYLHGRSIRDPELGDRAPERPLTGAAQELGPHVAALGMRFYTGESFPEEYHHQVFIPEHGSWNRSRKIGYRVTLVRLEGDRPVSYEVFAEGWLVGQSPWGRPVDLLNMPDGSLLLSDDFADVVYRISYQGAPGGGAREP